MTLSLTLRAGLASTTLVLIAGCTSSADGDRESAKPTPTTSSETSPAAADAPLPSVSTRLGDFPAFPEAQLPDPVAASLQAVLDEAVENGFVRGATAAVIVAGSGSWAGAAGVNRQGGAWTEDSRLRTASVGKTVTAAQVLRLVEDGKLRLDDRAADHFPPELAAFDANGASVRDLLGMRSGFKDPDRGWGRPIADRMRLVRAPFADAGSTIEYTNLNYLLLGEIIEQVTGRSLSQVTLTGVLAQPGLSGLTYSGVKNARAGDGAGMETDPATLARWGYELYGGSVLSDASLREMTDFGGEWYGLGAIDFTHPDAGTFDTPAVGHGGSEADTHWVRLVAFLRTGLVVSVQANADDFESVEYVLSRLREVVQPS